MISIIITSFKEEKTIGKAIEAFLQQKINEEYEIIVVAPDKETLEAAGKYKEYKQVKVFQDSGKGKTSAINQILPYLKGRIIILTDGDVYVSQNSVNEILSKFEDEKVGCVSGRPVPMEDKSTKWGFFANFLFDSADQLRLKLWNNKEFLEVSGYFWAFKNGIINKIPIDATEDSIVPLMFQKKGYKIGYAENAKVCVKNVNNWNDWINQKVRTSKGHETLNKYFPDRPVMKGLSQEAKGILKIFSYPKNLKEFFWFIQLIAMRGYMWYKVKTGEKFKGDWEAISSTK